MSIVTINPATEETIKEYQTMSSLEIVTMLEQSHLAFLVWREMPIEQRAKLMQQVATLLIKNKDKYSKLITTEMGKTILSARAEVEKCAWICEHFSKYASEYLQPRFVKTAFAKSYVMYQPTGTIFAIMPWNFPFLQVFRFAIPTLMLGNTCILKHAPITTGCGLAIEELFYEAGFPKNVFRASIIDVSQTEQIISSPVITGVSFTGSIKAGKIVAKQAGEHLKKCILELGGNDPYLILEDADLDHAAEQCVLSRLSNAGQVCVAAKRIIIVDAVRKTFVNKVTKLAKKYQYGNPLDESVNLGPLARSDLRDTVHEQVTNSINGGAKLIMGGKIPQMTGYYYPATVLDNIKSGTPAYDSEIFGPVISLISAADENEAIQIANKSSYGLGAAIFTKDIKRGEKIAARIEAGICAINTLVVSDPNLPFGGIKNSGFGRELADEGIREFANIKTVYVKN